MTKYTRLTGKVFGSSATATGDDPEIGQFGSALAGTYNGTTDVSVIQSLPAWQKGFISAVTPSTQFPPLPEMTGFGKVLSHQICYLLQQGMAEWDSGTTYYEDNWCAYNGKLYISKTDENLNNLPTNTTYWTQFTGGSGRNLGEYVTSSLPLIDDTLHLADGSLLSQTDYPELLSYIDNLYNSLPSGEFSQATLNANLSSQPDWTGIAYGNNIWVVVSFSYSSQESKFSTSTDGINWNTPSTLFSGYKASAICFGANLFVCITTDGYVISSADGTNWTATQKLGAHNWTCIAYGNGKYVAVDGYGYISTSTDGTNWNTTSSAVLNRSANETWKSICFDGSKFVALSDRGSIAFSNNGTDWQQNSNLVSHTDKLMSIVYDGSKYLIISEDGYTSTSQTGITWTSMVQDSKLGDNYWYASCFGQNKIVALGYSGYISAKEIPLVGVFTTEADWQATYTAYGECGKYVYNSGANTVRIPAVNSYFTNTTNQTQLGNITEASLPNIKGSGILNDDVSFCSGALYNAGSVSTTNSEPGGSSSKLVNFDANKSNAIYKDSVTTVNTQSIKQLVYIVVAK